MQPHQYAIGAGIIWLATLTVLPYLFATARRRAFDNGVKTGKVMQDHIIKLQLKEAMQALQDTRAELQLTQRACTQQLDARQADINTLKTTITELEARIMSYTGMPVTRPDYDLLISTVETLRLTEKTWKAAPGTEPWRNRATQQMQDIQALAMRVHSQLRNTPGSTAIAGEAA
ncbi:hypothetical protein EQ845_16725 [Pseudomonas putida]|uniref:hypothetical protein n=1 Tax=Pseudomonas putida TaxID=303 RepID=UPI00117ABB98|nr:hypothetical protein [Pseudomonas putida]TRO33892.1 hypothetical protein EQ845_16725 [Pseudomonas putida]